MKFLLVISRQVAVPDVVEAAKDADILVFVIPHQFIPGLCSMLLGKIKPTAVGLSLIKVKIISSPFPCFFQQIYFYESSLPPIIFFNIFIVLSQAAMIEPADTRY